MQHRSALIGPEISTCVLRIRLPAHDEPKSISTAKLVRSIEKYVGRATVQNNCATTIVLGDEDGYCETTGVESMWLAADKAHCYEHNLAVSFDPGEGAIIQLGSKSNPSHPHIRITITDLNTQDPVIEFLSRLRRTMNREEFIPASWVSIDKLSVTNFIKGLSLSDVRVKHYGKRAGFCEQLYYRERENICGYQFGESIGQGTTEPNSAPSARRVKHPFNWKQTRSIAIKESLLFGKQIWETQVEFSIGKPTLLSELEEFNPLAGLEILQRSHEGTWLPVPSWNPIEAWNPLLEKFRLITRPYTHGYF